MAFTEGLRTVYIYQKLQFGGFVDFLGAKKCQGAKMYSCSDSASEGMASAVPDPQLFLVSIAEHKLATHL